MATELEDLQEELADAKAALKRIYASGEERTIATRRQREAQAETLQKRIDTLRARINDLQNAASGGSRLITVVPR